MPTLPHKNPSEGYSIRIGKHLPKEAANLAYVHTDTPTPGKNLLIEDRSELIPENNLDGERRIYHAFLQEERLHTEEGLLLLPRPDIAITNLYGRDEERTPLFYAAKTKYPMDLRGERLSRRIGLNGESGVARYETYAPDDNDHFWYKGDRIQITKEDGRPLDADEVVRIQLNRHGSGSGDYLDDDYYQILVLSSFDSSSQNYRIHYPAFKNGRKEQRNEVLNFHPVEEEIKGDTYNPLSSYQVVEGPNGYTVSMEKSSEGQNTITHIENEPYPFQYQIQTQVQARLSEKNPATIKIGLAYINETIYNAVRIGSSLKKLVYNNPLLPAYLEFENPHPESGYSGQKGDANYWLVDLQMPTEQYLDYDILIFSGYGQKDFTSIRHSLEMFIRLGGTLLFDNCGTGSSVLNPINQSGAQTFLSDIRFSNSENQSGMRRLTNKASFQDRFFDIKDVSSMGTVRPTILLSGKENLADWTVYLEHQGGGPSILEKRPEEAGRIVVSNSGLMLDVLYGNAQTMKFLTNFLLHVIENRSFVTPLFKEQVRHRENLHSSEYLLMDGRTQYVDDIADDDETQLVAKKLLAASTREKVQPYLPKAYRKPQSLFCRINVLDSGNIGIENAGAEETNHGGAGEFETTTQNALPGYDFVKFSGTFARGKHDEQYYRSGKRSLNIQTTNAQGFFEQEISILPAGQYVLSSFVRSQNAAGGGMGVYNQDGVLIAKSKEISGTQNFTYLEFSFQLDESTLVYFRLGAHDRALTTNLWFDDIDLKSSGIVRMTPDNSGEEPLYAYALAPKGQNTLANFANSQDEYEILQVDQPLSGILLIRSFVYQWFGQEGLFKKEYGNQKATPFTVSFSEGEKVLDNLLALLPPLKSGVEWASKQNVFYELSLLVNPDSDYIDISLFDPSIQAYFFRPDGQWVINHEDLFYDGLNSTVQARVKALVNGLKPTRYRYSLLLKKENQIRVLFPKTLDERDRWYLRVQNGSFTRKQVHAQDERDLVKLGRPDFYDRFVSGEHIYAVPEYYEQSFFPKDGQRLIKDERVEYLDRRKVRVQQTPMIVREEELTEVLSDLDGTKQVFYGTFQNWSRSFVPNIYYDEFENGSQIELTTGFRIDYEKGRVYLDVPIARGRLEAHYVYDNFSLVKRKYSSQHIQKEQLVSEDGYTYHSLRENWLVSPEPRIWVSGTPAISGSYAIDYDSGSIRFFQKQEKTVQASYQFFVEETVPYDDINLQTGEIMLSKGMSFKEEIYASYVVRENTYEYKGYYDEAEEVFLHLDLNPTAGHTFTLRQQDAEGRVFFRETASEKLLGREVYLYLLPKQSAYYPVSRKEDQCVRHSLSKEEWLLVKKTYPQALLLAIIQVRENTNVSQAIVMDARREGGGLKEHISQEQIEQKVGYSSAFWDIGSYDGMAYYRGGVTIIRLPESVLRENGGLFDETEVREIVDKYVAYGVYPIIEYTS